MVIGQVMRIESAQAHLASVGYRTVWDGDFAEISGTHLHAGDIGGAIVSVDEPRRASSWMWADRDWDSIVATAVVSGLAAVRVASSEPADLWHGGRKRLPFRSTARGRHCPTVQPLKSSDMTKRADQRAARASSG